MVIMFIFDNGLIFNGGSDFLWFDSGGFFRFEYGWGKCFVYEGGICIFVIVIWFGKIKLFIQSDYICGFQDVMFILVDIVNIVCLEIDGISFLFVLFGEMECQKEYEYLYWEYFDFIIGFKVICMGKWKGIVNNICKGNFIMEFYDLESDFREEYDVVVEYFDIVWKLMRLMEKLYIELENFKFRF